MEPPRWFRQRGYAHFDRPLTLEQAVDLAGDPEKVAAHAFWPLLRFTKRVPRYARDPATKKRHRVEPKERELCYAAHSDAHIYAKYAAEIDAKLEEHYRRRFGASVLAYRRLDPAQSNVDFAVSAFVEVQKRGDCDVLALDVKDFFGSLDHALLKRRWAALIGDSRSLPRDHHALFRAITRFKTIERGRVRELLGRDVPRSRGKHGLRVCEPIEFRKSIRPHVQPFQRTAGIPQGSPISAVLANLYMLEVDEDLHARLDDLGASYRRYSDDILVIGPPGCAQAAEGVLAEAVDSAKLTLQPEKTLRLGFRVFDGVQFCRPLGPHGPDLAAPSATLQYLGLAWNGRAIRLKQATVAGFIAKMVHAVRSAEARARRNGQRRIYRRKLYRKFSRLGRSVRIFGPQDSTALRHRNFIQYGLGAAKLAGGEALRKQIGRLWIRLNREIQKAEQRL